MYLNIASGVLWGSPWQKDVRTHCISREPHRLGVNSGVGALHLPPDPVGEKKLVQSWSSQVRIRGSGGS